MTTSVYRSARRRLTSAARAALGRDGHRLVARGGRMSELVGAVPLVVPGAAVPVLIAGEVDHARPFGIESDVEVVALLVEEVAGVGGLVAPAAVVGAAM
jgi:hypothetical protein